MRQFRSPLIYILAVAAVVSVAIGEPTDAAFIAGVLGLNALIGGYQEWRAEKSTQALQQLLQIRAAVVRDGEVCEMEAENVVPGDTVWLESGNRVPADLARLFPFLRVGFMEQLAERWRCREGGIASVLNCPVVAFFVELKT